MYHLKQLGSSKNTKLTHISTETKSLVTTTLMVEPESIFGSTDINQKEKHEQQRIRSLYPVFAISVAGKMQRQLVKQK